MQSEAVASTTVEPEVDCCGFSAVAAAVGDSLVYEEQLLREPSLFPVGKSDPMT